MDKNKLQHFKELLETRRNELRTSVTRTEEDGREANPTDAAQDIVDRATGSYNKEFLFARNANERQMLQMVDGALARIDEGIYGECITCGTEIGERRLEAVPWARHCIACQDRLEKGELHQQTGT